MDYSFFLFLQKVVCMIKLNFPEYAFRLKSEDGKLYIFDAIRKKFLLCTPEEWVRQHLVQYLLNERNYPASLIALEMGISYNDLKRRCDIVVFERHGLPLLIVECKAPRVKISQDTFDQIARYNMKLRVPWLVVSNGIEHYTCKVDFGKKSYRFIKEIPLYNDLEHF